MSGAPVRKTSAAAPPGQFASDPLELLPDGMGVAVINVKQMVASDVWALVMGSNKATHAIQKAESELSSIGLKVSDLAGVAVAIPVSPGTSAVAVASGSFSPSDIIARLRDNGNVKLTSEKYKGLDVYRVVSTSSTNHSDVTFAFYDGGTAVVGPATGVRYDLR
jgi:hypothetical protein